MFYYALVQDCATMVCVQGEAKDTEGVATTSTKPMFDHARLDGWGSYVAGMTSVITRRPRPTST